MAEKSLSIRIEPALLQKLHYIAKYEDRSANGEILQLIRKRVREFESEHGEIELAVKSVAADAGSYLSGRR